MSLSHLGNALGGFGWRLGPSPALVFNNTQSHTYTRTHMHMHNTCIYTRTHLTPSVLLLPRSFRTPHPHNSFLPLLSPSLHPGFPCPLLWGPCLMQAPCCAGSLASSCCSPNLDSLQRDLCLLQGGHSPAFCLPAASALMLDWWPEVS